VKEAVAQCTAVCVFAPKNQSPIRGV